MPLTFMKKEEDIVAACLDINTFSKPTAVQPQQGLEDRIFRWISYYKRDICDQVCHHGGSLTLFVKRGKEGTLRLFVDYKELNKYIIDNKLPFILNR